MISIFLDSETTGINPLNDEVIEAYFAVYDNDIVIDDFLLQARVDKWCDIAAKFHKIPYAEAMLYPEKKDSYRNLIRWLSKFKSFKLKTFANKNTELGHINFDLAIIENELNLLGCPNYYLLNKLGMKPAESIHTLAQKLSSSGSFKALTAAESYELGISKNPKHKNSSRKALSQEAVYYALFNSRYDSHRAKTDVEALYKIEKELIRLRHETTSFFI